MVEEEETAAQRRKRERVGAGGREEREPPNGDKCGKHIHRRLYCTASSTTEDAQLSFVASADLVFYNLNTRKDLVSKMSQFSHRSCSK